MMKFQKSAMLLSAVLLGSVLTAVPVSAEELTPTVTVTISDDGKLALVQKSVTVTDIDNDGKYTINDALYAAHEQNYDGGASAGYDSKITQYGISLEKLWGNANGGNYGYYVNHHSAMSLGDEIQTGDSIDAFSYTDSTAWSDKYCYFDISNLETESGKDFTLQLSYAGFDENWNPLTLPVENAVITVNGEKTDFKTDKDGNVTLHLDNAGENQISAVSDSMILVPPVCMVSVAGTESNTETTQTTETTETNETDETGETTGTGDFNGLGNEGETSFTTTHTTVNPSSTTIPTTTKTLTTTKAVVVYSAKPSEDTPKTESPVTGDKATPAVLAITAFLAAGTALILKKHE